MRVFSILTAMIVAAALYLWVIERDLLFALASAEAPAAEEGATAGQAVPAEPGARPVSVVAIHSRARQMERGVLARGQSEAARAVEVRAETSGRVISEPLRKGAFVQEGEVLCRIDSGTREVALEDARARLAEAMARVPAAEAALQEAQSRVPAARAALAEAESRIPAAEAALAEAQSRVPAAEAALAEAESRVPAAEAALAEAQTRVPAAEAALTEAEARVPAAEAALRQAEAQLPLMEARRAEAEARLEEAQKNYDNTRTLFERGFASQTQLNAARAALESAIAGVEAVKSQLEGALAGVEQARSTLAGAKAAVEQAHANLAGAKAAVISAESQLQTARAGVAQARSQLESAHAAVISARANVEGAKAAVESARSQQESAEAGVESARAQVESARAAIQTAEAQVASAETELQRIEIRAPFAGLLETDAAELGSLLQPGGLCATVMQLDPMKLVGFIPETRVDEISTGARAIARLSSGREVAGTVTFLARAADPTTRTFRVEVEVANPDLGIRDGQTAEILIESTPQQAHFLPQSALTLDDEGRIGVRTVRPGEVAGFAPVEIIRDARDGVWVAGLPEEVDVIVVGQQYVGEGVPLAVTWQEAAK